MKNSVEVNKMLSNIESIMISAYEIENQASRMQYNINYSLHVEGKLIIDKQLLEWYNHRDSKAFSLFWKFEKRTLTT